MDVPLPAVGRISKSCQSEQSYLCPTVAGTGDFSWKRKSLLKTYISELLPDLRWARAAPGHAGALLAVSPVEAATQP